MNGTPKQIKWANDICEKLLPIMRAASVIDIDLSSRKFRRVSQDTLDEARKLLAESVDHTEAGDWIDWRHQPEILVRAYHLKKYQKELDAPIENMAKALMVSAGFNSEIYS